MAVPKKHPGNFESTKTTFLYAFKNIELMLTTKMIGQKMAEARKKVNMSQTQLAQQLFISAQAVGKWERGESMPDITTFNRLAELLGVDLNYFSDNFPSTAAEKATPVVSERPAAGSSSGKQDKKLSRNMSRGNWVDADFSGLKDLHENFSSSNMQKCLFIGSDLSGLLLKGNNVDSCDFSRSDLSQSHIQSSNLANNSFKDCLLKETEFSSSHLMNCNFSGTDLSGTTFKSGGFQSNPVTEAIWHRTAFMRMYLADIIFTGTLEDCSFEGCDFKKVTFENATLMNTFFKDNDLKRVRFVNCQADNITYAFLKSGKADMSGITLLL